MIYDYTLKANDGSDFALSDYKGKVLRFVNTATRCGFPPQYKGLEIIDIPCNQFMAQTPEDDQGIQQICSLKYKTRFRRMKKAETNGEAQVKAMADKVRAAGFAEADDEMEIFAKQEGHHGVVIGKILEKYQPEKKAPAGKVYICPVCGFEHEGDINDEPDDYVCPLCGQPKSIFKEAK